MDFHFGTLSRNLVFYLICISPGLRNVFALSGGAEVPLPAKSQARCCQEGARGQFWQKDFDFDPPSGALGQSSRARQCAPRLDLFLLPSHRSSLQPSFSPASKRLLIRGPPSTSGAAKTTFLVVDPKWVSWEVSLSNTKRQQFQDGSFC